MAASTFYDSDDDFFLENLEYLERRNRLELERNDDLDDIDFYKRYRFRKRTIENLIRMLSPKLTSDTNRNRALSATEQILIALRFFASGSYQINVGDLQGLSQPAVSRTIQHVARCLAELRPMYINLPQSEIERQEISQKFYDLCGFPSVYGPLDCTHIPIKSPGGINAETFRCRKGFFSINVQTLSDTNLKIRAVSARWPGSVHDMTVFDRSYLRAVLETEVPPNYHVLGDNGYALRPYLMTPFLKPQSEEQRRYNRAHILGRNVVERQYGVLKKRFGCLATRMRCSLETSTTVIVALCVLHNIAIDMGDLIQEDPVSIDSDSLVNALSSLGGETKRNMIVSEWFTE